MGVDSMRDGCRVAATPLAVYARTMRAHTDDERAIAAVAQRIAAAYAGCAARARFRSPHGALAIASANESEAQFRLVAANALYRAHSRTAARTTFMRAMQTADSAVSITRWLRSAAASRIEKHAYADAENARGAIETIDGETRTDRR
jgi:hypothetical protein